jgi:hypothetical protein
MPSNAITIAHTSPLIDQMVGESLHVKQVESITNAAIGVVHAVSLSIHAIGAGLAAARGLQSKHAVKQVDRLLSNPALDIWALFAHWVPYVVTGQSAIVVALDWTDFDADGQAMIALSLVTAHGRALPLIWRTVRKATLKGRRNRYEDEVLLRLHEVLPPGVRVTVLADRGFGDQQLYAVLKDFGFDFVVRFRGAVTVESRTGEVRTAADWVPRNGMIRQLRAARVTQDRTPIDSVVCVKQRGMQTPWCLAIGGATITGAQAVRLYGRRFTIEEAFRDVKDPRYGLGMSATHIGDVSLQGIDRRQFTPTTIESKLSRFIHACDCRRISQIQRRQSCCELATRARGQGVGDVPRSSNSMANRQVRRPRGIAKDQRVVIRPDEQEVASVRSPSRWIRNAVPADIGECTQPPRHFPEPTVLVALRVQDVLLQNRRRGIPSCGRGIVYGDLRGCRRTSYEEKH